MKNSQEPSKTPGPIKTYVHDVNYQISRVLSLRNDLRDLLEYEFAGKTLVGAEFQRLVQLVYESLPGELHWQTLEDSLRHFAGVPLTKDAIYQTCWRLAGNVNLLRARKPVTQWRVQRWPEWVPFQILSCRRSKSGRGRIGSTFALRILAGTSAGMLVFQWWTDKQVRYMAQDFGFSKLPSPNSKYPAKYPYLHPAQYVSLRAYALVTKASAEEPVLTELKWPKGVKDWNTDLIKGRYRLDKGYGCPEKYPNTFLCHQCPIGQGKCRASTHKLDWVKKECSVCKQLGWFDLDLTEEQCVDCYHRDLFKRKT